jgi:capsular polysaccharide export protein
MEMNNAHIVFLQGLPTPFFTRVARELTARGCRTTGINLCLGDQLFWRGAYTVNYRGRLADWAQFIADFYDKNGVTGIVLLGEQRSYHQQAIKLAQARGISVTVTDFGYLRPDWMTFERDGMGGDSHFPKDAQAILALAADAPRADLTQRYTDGFWTMAWGDMAYHFANFFYFWLFPFYRRPYKRNHPLVHYVAIGRRLLFAKRGHRHAQAKLAQLQAEQVRYFLFPLQLENDFQIVSYSPFDSLEDAIWLVLQSFAQHAEADTRLLIKVHPLDPGLKSWQKIILRWTHELGITQRVDYVDGGNLDGMILASQGVVTVNSTVGIRALQLARPVITLGDAIYDVQGLTSQQGIDAFWRAPLSPTPMLVDAFIDAVCHYLQIRGTFYSEPGLSAAVTAAATKIQAGNVGVPL